MNKELSKAMIDKDISQKDLAEKVDVTASFMSLLVSNKRCCTIKTARKIANVLEVKIDDIF